MRSSPDQLHTMAQDESAMQYESFEVLEERQVLYNLLTYVYNRPWNHEGSARLKKVPTAHSILEYGLCPRMLWVIYTILSFFPIINILLLILYCVWLFYLVKEYSIVMRNNRRVKDPFALMVQDSELELLFEMRRVSEEEYTRLFPGRNFCFAGEQVVTFYSPELRTTYEQIILIGFCTYLYVLAMVPLVVVSIAMDILWYVGTTHDW